LSIIPSAFPTHFITTEEVDSTKGKTSLQNKIRNSHSAQLDTTSSTWNTHKLERKICDKSLETILRIAKKEMQIHGKVC
jgi:hypothetical protein